MALTPSQLDNPDAIRIAAGALDLAFASVEERTESIALIWRGLSSSYEAPEAGVVHEAMEKPWGYARTVRQHAATMKKALYSYAAQLEELERVRAQLVADIAEHEDRLHSMETADVAMVMEADELAARVEAFETEVENAQRECGNALSGTWGGPRFVPIDKTHVNNPYTYGTSADGKRAQTRTGQAPWGVPDAWRRPDKDAQVQLMGLGVLDSIKDTFGSLWTLSGVDGDDGATEYARSSTWHSGIRTLAELYALRGKDFNEIAATLSNEESHLNQLARGMLSLDTWGADPWRTTGSFAPDVAGIAFGVGAGKLGLRAATKLAPGVAVRVSGLVDMFHRARGQGTVDLLKTAKADLDSVDISGLNEIAPPRKTSPSTPGEVEKLHAPTQPGHQTSGLLAPPPEVPSARRAADDSSAEPVNTPDNLEDQSSATASPKTSGDVATRLTDTDSPDSADTSPPADQQPTRSSLVEDAQLAAPGMEAPREGTRLTPGSRAKTYDPDDAPAKTLSAQEAPRRYTQNDVQDTLDRAPRNEHGQPVDHRTGRPLLLTDSKGYRGWYMRWDPNAQHFVAENRSLTESGLPAIGPKGGYGYDPDGNLLPYANSRPSFPERLIRLVWNRSRKEQLAEIASGDLDLPMPGANEMWVRTVDGTTGPDIHTLGNESWRKISWEPGQPRKGIWDMGHLATAPYKKLRHEYLSGKISMEKFLDEFLNAKNYRVEDPLRNQSHVDEIS